jgi:organic radical activating enzyme
MKKARFDLTKNNKIDYCKGCYIEEDHSGTSKRIRGNQKSVIFIKENFEQSFVQSPSYSKFSNPHNDVDLPIDLHIDLGNYCNLACKMCDPLASSKIETQHRIWGLVDKVSSKWTDDQEVWDKFLLEIITIPKLKNIHFMGGETIIQPRFEELIDFLLQHGRTDVCISFVSNGTVYNERLFEKLKKFTRVGIEVSIETLSETNAYIRQGTNTETVISHIEKYIVGCNGTSITLTLRPALSALSVRDYWQVIEYALKNKLLLQSLICVRPPFLNISVLPTEIRKTYKSNYYNLLEKYQLTETNTDINFNESALSNYKESAKIQILSMLSLLEQPIPINQDTLLNELVKHLQKWDKIYSYDATILYPELKELFETHGYSV